MLNLRELNELEISNLAFLTRYNLDFGLLEPTATGLAKSILDATFEYRSFLSRQGIHDYVSQAQGPEHKRFVPARVLTSDGVVVETQASLYRPQTKQGDPRIWFARLGRYCAPKDIIASIWVHGAIWLLNVSQVGLSAAVIEKRHYRDLLHPLLQDKESIFEELLAAMRAISARGFIPTLRRGDTGVGHLLETELGIKANSSKAPDYKGVEIKSTRAKTKRNLNLFAKVPNWKLSDLHSIRAFWQEFGYDKGDGKGWRLNCTVSGAAFNSQGLRLKVDEKEGLLHEISDRSSPRRPLTWELEVLRNSLAEKHADTFWMKAESRVEGSVELIRYHSVVQTSKPILQQLAPMLSAGSITVDHVINPKSSVAGASPREAGPLFKVLERRFTDLFPIPVVHSLLPDGEGGFDLGHLSKKDVALANRP